MSDLLWMLSSMSSGAIIALLAIDATGRPWVGLVVAVIAGWAMAQRDHNYRRVRGLDTDGDG